MRNEILDKALKILEQRRLRAEVECNARVDEINLKIPQVTDIRKELALTSIRLSKLILSKEKDITNGIEEIKAANLSLQQMEKDLLVKGGFPSDYLEVSYFCKKCNDKGFVDGERCECLNALMKKINFDEVNRLSALKLSSFSDFDLGFYSRENDENTGAVPFEQMSKILTYCKNYAENFTPRSKGIFMKGHTGLGKTHLSLAIANRVIEKGYTVVYGAAYDLLRKIEDENFGRTENKDTLGSVLDADLLILDDLGAEFNSPFNLSMVYNIIDARCNREKATIISSNLDISELEERYSKRLVSRLISLFTYLHFIGNDVRQLKPR